MLYKLTFRSRWSLGDMDISYLFLANDSCDECTKTLPYHTDSLGWSSSLWKKSCTTLIKPCKSWDNLPTLSPYLDFWTKNNAYPPKVIYITSLSSLLALKSPKYIQPLSNKYNWCFLVNQKWPSKHKLLHWYRAYPEQWYPKGQLGKPPLTRSLSFFRVFFDGKFRVLLIWIAWLAYTWELQQVYQKSYRKIVFHTFRFFLKLDERTLTVVDFKTTKISICMSYLRRTSGWFL